MSSWYGTVVLQVLGIEPGRLLRLVDAQSGTASSTSDGR